VETLIDYQVQLIQFPTGKVHETVTENEDGTYTIFIDCTLSRIEQIERCKHALKHIMQRDFDTYDVDKVERIAHDFRNEISKELCPAI